MVREAVEALGRLAAMVREVMEALGRLAAMVREVIGALGRPAVLLRRQKNAEKCLSNGKKTLYLWP